MDVEEIREVPIVDFLQRLGHEPIKRQGNRVWFRAPYREEKEPSFNVNLSRNVWFDFGLGKGGDIFNLAGVMIGSPDFKEQLNFIRGSLNDFPVEWDKTKYPIYNKVEEPTFEEVEFSPLRSYVLLRYLEERGISSYVATANCHEVRYSNHKKRYFGIAFKNVGGGCEVRTKFFKGCISPKDVSVIKNGSDVCNIYEGFMDYLSAVTLEIGKEEDHLVLNSVSNLEKSFGYLNGYRQINCYLDNDDAGRRTLSALRKHFDDSATNVVDCSSVSYTHSDAADE